MRLLIFSDLHGNQYAWRAFLRQMETVPYDQMIFLGDIFGYYYGQAEIVRDLYTVKNLIWLKGNHDRFFEDLLEGKADPKILIRNYGQTYRQNGSESAWMKKLISPHPYFYEICLDGKKLLFCHGTPSNPVDGRCYPKDLWEPSMCGKYDVVICGHTHFRMVRQGGGKLWLNVGSVGQPRDGNKSGALLFDTCTCGFEFIDVIYDKTPLFREIEQNDPHLSKLKDILERERA